MEIFVGSLEDELCVRSARVDTRLRTMGFVFLLSYLPEEATVERYLECTSPASEMAEGMEIRGAGADVPRVFIF